MTACPACADTGYRPGESPCICDARPFPVARPAAGRSPAAPTPVLTRREAALADIDRHCSGAELTAEIDQLLHVCSALLAAPIGLGEMVRYIQLGGPLRHVAPRILTGCDLLDQAATYLPEAAARLRTLAEEAAA